MVLLFSPSSFFFFFCFFFVNHYYYYYFSRLPSVGGPCLSLPCSVALALAYHPIHPSLWTGQVPAVTLLDRYPGYLASTQTRLVPCCAALCCCSSTHLPPRLHTPKTPPPLPTFSSTLSPRPVLASPCLCLVGGHCPSPPDLSALLLIRDYLRLCTGQRRRPARLANAPTCQLTYLPTLPRSLPSLSRTPVCSYIPPSTGPTTAVPHNTRARLLQILWASVRWTLLDPSRDRPRAALTSHAAFALRRNSAKKSPRLENERAGER